MVLHSHCRGRQPGDPKLPEQRGTLYGISYRYLLLASPGGKPRTQKPLVITIQRASQLRRFRVAKLATPTGRGGNYESTAANAVHPLRQPVQAASSPGGSQGVQTFSLYALLQLMWKIFYFLF